MYRGFSGGWAHGGYAFGFPWGGLVMGILVLAVIALAVYQAIRMGRSRKTEIANSADRGIDILIDRYTRGEIDADKFREMKDVLEGKTKSSS